MDRYNFIVCVVILLIGCGSEELAVNPPDSERIPVTESSLSLKSVDPESKSNDYPIGPVPSISIHQAASEGRIEIVRQHISVQAPDYVNTQDKNGWTPLHFAYAKGQNHMSRFLLENGAEYEARNNFGQAPFDIVLLNNNFRNSSFALVELFTSDACSSCPPAERLTSEIRQFAQAKRLKVYCISFHVDYFNGANWTDEFSDPKYSARQRAYEFKRFSGMYYTPQMIINGDYQMLGHNKVKAYNTINQVLKKSAKISVSVRQVKKEKNFVSVNACVLGEFVNSALCVVLVENGIRRRITGGENKGRTLNTDNVVLDFQFVEINGPTGHEFSFSEKMDPNRNFTVVAFVQNIDSMSILGAHGTPIRQIAREKLVNLNF